MSSDAASLSPEVLSDRARAAAEAVDRRFGHRLLGLPGTWIAAVKRPGAALPWTPWHYWWQAHYLDCLVDAAERELAARGDSGGAAGGWPPSLTKASQLLRTIRLRNFLFLVNSYFDDMAWLALSASRAAALAGTLPGPGLPRAARAVRTLEARLDAANTPELGGGLFWNTKRKFKNTAATAPAALHFARSGRSDTAQALVDWLVENLLDRDQGLFLDGLRITGAGVRLEPAVFTYNQGPVLGALLELGGAGNLAAASALVSAVADRLTVPVPSGVALRTHGGGDGGLFTGILVRNLADAALHPGLPAQTRATARDLVLGTAEALWSGRSGADPEVFPAGTEEHTEAAGAAVELSTQLQAWMTFEAAPRVAARIPR